MKLRTETVYDARAPWSDLGAEIAGKKNVPAILKAAKIDWAVEKRALEDGHGNTSPAFGIFRETDNACLGVVGSRYKPIQNAEAFDLFADFLRDGGAKMEVAGSLSGGKLVWGLARIDDDYKLPGKDSLTPYLFLGIPHGIGRSLTFRVVTKRDVCNNNLSIAMRDRDSVATWSMRHSSVFDLPKKQAAKELIAGARDEAKEHQRIATKLSKIKVTDEQAAEVVRRIFGSKVDVDVEKDRVSLRVRQILDAYRHAPGAMPGNAWGVLNGVTYWTDHIASRTSDKRMESAFIGPNAKKKAKVVADLLALA